MYLRGWLRVTSFAQVAAALAGGAVLAMAAMAAVQLRAVRRGSERDQRIRDARRLITDGVETFRQEVREDRDAPAMPGAGELPACAVDVGGRAHLRMLVDGEATTPARRAPGPVRQPPGQHSGRPGPPSRTGRSGPVRGR